MVMMMLVRCWHGLGMSRCPSRWMVVRSAGFSALAREHPRPGHHHRGKGGVKLFLFARRIAIHSAWTQQIGVCRANCCLCSVFLLSVVIIMTPCTPGLLNDIFQWVSLVRSGEGDVWEEEFCERERVRALARTRGELMVLGCVRVWLSIELGHGIRNFNWPCRPGLACSKKKKTTQTIDHARLHCANRSPRAIGARSRFGGQSVVAHTSSRAACRIFSTFSLFGVAHHQLGRER